MSNKYDSYKDSGIEWIGEIPSHWKVTKLKFIGNIICGGTPSTTNEEYWTGNIPWIQSGKVQNNIVLSNVVEKKITESALVESSTKLVKKDSVLIAITGATCSNIGYLTFETAVNQSIVAIEPSNFNSVLLFNLLKSQKEQILFHQSGGAQGGVTKGDIMNIYIPYPPVEEQTTIANYLDQKTSQIDDLIAKKERLIQLLEEERTAIINQSVTKGLDPTVPMKDSGIEWLGEIPAHWEVAKFNLYVSIRHGHQFMNHDFTDDGVKVVKITQLHKDGYLDLSRCSYVSSEQLDNYQSILIKEQDILMCLTGGTIGKIIRVGEVNEPLLQNYRVGHFSSGNVSKISDDFIFWMMSSESIVSQIFFQMRETGQPNIGMDDFGRMRITIPPLMEQEKIVKHIVNKTAEISEILIKSKQEYLYSYDLN